MSSLVVIFILSLAVTRSIVESSSVQPVADPTTDSDSRLQVLVPHKLRKPNGYSHQEALFGIPSYGASLQQFLYYADSDLCSLHFNDDAIARGGYPAREMDSSTGKMKRWPSPFILMVDRGRCTSVTKVRNAQHLGAAAVIIADNTCLCTSATCISDEGCRTDAITMRDDGSGADIVIPSVLLYKEDADLIKKELMSNHMVRIEMAWPLPTTNIVKYDLWTTPTNVDFLREFRDAAVALADRAHFTPHMCIYNGISYGCQSADGETQCYHLCTNNGRYCAIDPDNVLDKGISGADVVRESLRRICAWKLYGEQDGIGTKWWNYVILFTDRCSSDTNFMLEACVKSVMQNVLMDYTKVQDCMSNSGGLDGNVPNAILEKALMEKEKTGVVIVPAVYVNRRSLHGAVDLPVLFKAICSAFRDSEPAICRSCMYCADIRGCIQNGGKCSHWSELPHGSYGGGDNSYGGNGKRSGTISTDRYFSMMLLVVALMSGAAAVLYQRNRIEMRERVREIVTELISMEQQRVVEGGGGAEQLPTVARSMGSLVVENSGSFMIKSGGKTRLSSAGEVGDGVGYTPVSLEGDHNDAQQIL
mmetsp:Transcript_34167/g.48555  ORF Transcript_34167/g.48555 Transcript_34167/m.48555 type:complete len:589 (+) Transcript_34167:2-1768(+)